MNRQVITVEKLNELASSAYYSQFVFSFFLNGKILLYQKRNGLTTNLNSGRKVFRGLINMGVKRKIQARCAYMALNKKNYKLKTFTLTYKAGYDTSETKKHLNRFLTWLKKPRIKDKWLGVENYLYTVEKTKKQTVHYHFVIDCDFMNMQKIKQAWCKSRGSVYHHSAVNGFKVINNVEHAINYFSKYLTKQTDVFDNYVTEISEVDDQYVESKKYYRRYGNNYQLSRAKINTKINFYQLLEFERCKKVDIQSEIDASLYQKNPVFTTEFVEIMNLKRENVPKINKYFEKIENFACFWGIN